MIANIDAVIVTHNSSETITTCIESIRNMVSDCNIIVVDTQSMDDTLDRASQTSADTIISVENIGFGCACNAGVASGNAPWILLMNPDAEIIAFDQSIMNEASDIVAPSIVDVNDHSRINIFKFPTMFTDILAEFGMNNESEACINDQHSWISGACLLIERRIYYTIGGFDEDYFLFREDTDLCKRLRNENCSFSKANWLVRHVGGVSTGKDIGFRTICRLHSRIVYSTKHYGNTGRYALQMALLVAAAAKSILALFTPSRKSSTYFSCMFFILKNWNSPLDQLKRELRKLRRTERRSH